MVPVELLEAARRHLELHAAEYDHPGQPETIDKLRAIIDGPGVEPVASWIDGAPPFPQNQEWFIATTIYDEKVVLRALPEEYAYDYTTADYTYIKASNIRCWMQFPDCEYLPPKAAPSAPVAGCHECGKLASDGWALYCVECAEKIAPAQAVPDGWRLVPEAPTKEMIRAMRRQRGYDMQEQRMYSEAIDAAPQPPSTAQPSAVACPIVNDPEGRN